MKKAISVLLAGACILALAQCLRSNRMIKTWFWKNDQTGTARYLYINDVYKGELPSLPRKHSLEKVREQALYLPMTSGEYEVKVQDREGNVTSAEMLEVYYSWHGHTVHRYRTDDEDSPYANEDDCQVEVVFE